MEKDRGDNRSPAFFRRMLYSVFPGLRQPAGQRGRYRLFFNSLLLHFRPRTVNERTLRLTLSWGLGGMAAVLIGVLFATGLLLKFYYAPFTGQAYESILYLQEQVVFGKLIRNVHHWSANGLLLAVFIHFLRVFFTGAFHAPRQFNWVIGLGLFLVVLASNFTGYLLPWDQLAFWAVTISSGMLEYVPWIGEWFQRLLLGGSEVSSATLSIFYAVHTAVLPVLLVIVMPFHFWRVRKAGGLVVPHRPEEAVENRGRFVDTIPALIVREVAVALVVMAVVLMVSVLINAPLESKANPGLSPNPTKAPWYFSGIQEMLVHFHPLFSLFIIPAMMLMALVALPYLNYDSNPAGIWFCSGAGRKAALAAAVTASIITPAAILADEYFTTGNAWIPGVPTSISNGLIPLAAVLVAVSGFYFLVKKRFSLTKNEAVQAVYVLFWTGFLICMVINIWFRGAGMVLMWPWEVHIKGL